jgi:hypothetical protein
LHGPLRIAIAGRVKAGKSTILNSLVGERLAPTDAGECTRLVTWYRSSDRYQIRAVLRDGDVVEPPFLKGASQLEIDLPAGREVERLEIGWPSRHLMSATLVDTPGLGSLTTNVAAAPYRLLGLDGSGPGEVDAVVYLMRHAHAEDATFLEGFLESGLALGSPVNTVAVLSRVDEIAGGRLDALDSAQRVAARYANDSRLRPLVGAIVPVAGLLAETATTLEEVEYGWLSQIAMAPDSTDLLLSVERFRDGDRNPLTNELRERLLRRFGLFGIRFVVRALQERQVATANELARMLVDRCGLAHLRTIIGDKLTARAQPLVTRSAVLELRNVADAMRAVDGPTAERIEAQLEEIEAGDHRLAELVLLHAIAVGDVDLTDAEAEEAERVAGSGNVTDRLGLDADASQPDLQRAALDGIARWRARAANPLTALATSRAAEVMARSYEGLFAAITETGPDGALG